MVVLRYLPKLKRGLGLAFGAYFLHDFSKKIFFNTLSTDKVSMSYLFSFPRYQANCVIKFFFYFSIIMITRKVKINLNDINQTPTTIFYIIEGKLKC